MLEKNVESGLCFENVQNVPNVPSVSNVGNVDG